MTAQLSNQGSGMESKKPVSSPSPAIAPKITVTSSPEITQAVAFMDAYAQRTSISINMNHPFFAPTSGSSSDKSSAPAATDETSAKGGTGKRYLWTDAFAVCNWIGLARSTGDMSYLCRALSLVDLVHHQLGCHRADAEPVQIRGKWLSGLNEAEGEEHPTAGGLRIGKPLADRRADQPFNERLEWERDGQYYHYLTKWVCALDILSRDALRHPQVYARNVAERFHRWSHELAVVAQRAFTISRGEKNLRMVWKMSCEISRVLVPSQGHHDPLDGFITAMQLIATARVLRGTDASSSSSAIDTNTPAGSNIAARQQSTPVATEELTRVMNVYSSMLENQSSKSLSTSDSLGLGGLLCDAYRLYQVSQQGIDVGDWLNTLLASCVTGVYSYVRQFDPSESAHHRLAFRELGLAIGLHAVDRIPSMSKSPSATATAIMKLKSCVSLKTAIIEFWLKPEHRRTDSWIDHRDINEVMLATALVPDGYLDLSLPLSTPSALSEPSKQIDVPQQQSK